LHRFSSSYDCRVVNRKIDSLLAFHHARPSALARLLGQSALQEERTAELRALLPQELAAQCRVGNVRDHILTVHINNAAWATRLRFVVPDLLPRLRTLADFADVTEIRLRVVAAAAVAKRPPADEPTVQPAARIPLVELARTIDSADLQGAILRLAAHADAPARAPAQGSAPESEG
jgi:hypothetical protein